MIRLILSFFLLLILLETSFAGKFLPNAFEAQFDQQKMKKLKKSSSNVVVSQIEIKYKFPSNINFKTIGDSETQYVCNQDMVWIYTPPFIPGEKGEVRVGNSSKFCYSKIFDALSHGLKTNKLYKVKKVSDRLYDLMFSEKAQSQIPYKKISLEFKGQSSFQNISKISLFKELDKSPVVLVTKSLVAKKNISQSEFEFKIPENTNKIKMK